MLKHNIYKLKIDILVYELIHCSIFYLFMFLKYFYSCMAVNKVLCTRQHWYIINVDTYHNVPIDNLNNLRKAKYIGVFSCHKILKRKN